MESSRQVSKETEDLNSTLNRPDLNTAPTTCRIYLFSSTRGSFAKKDRIRAIKQLISEFTRTEIMQSLFHPPWSAARKVGLGKFFQCHRSSEEETWQSCYCAGNSEVFQRVAQEWLWESMQAVLYWSLNTRKLTKITLLEILL